MSSFSRAASAAMRAVSRRPTVATTTTTSTATRSTAATAPLLVNKTQSRAFVKESRPRPQASNRDKDEPHHAGTFARTDDSITVEYPEDHELPSSEPIVGAGRAGLHIYPTLANFSLQGNVGVVTGGARGLGLVMGQGMVVSGADLAIVDMNSKSHAGESQVGRPWVGESDQLWANISCALTEDEAEVQAQALMEQFKKDNPNAKKWVLTNSSHPSKSCSSQH